MRTKRGSALQFLNSLPDIDDCIEWPFSYYRCGYGQATYKGKGMNAHRLSLVIATGVNPQNMVAAHGPCHNPKCVNPNHLSWSSRSSNQLDRRRDSTCNSICQTAALMADHMRGHMTQLEIGRMLGIAHSTVSNIHRKVKRYNISLS